MKHQTHSASIFITKNLINKSIKIASKTTLLYMSLFIITSNVAGQINITTLGTPYTQDFNSLIISGNQAWKNDTTLTGWYSTATEIYADDGKSAFGGRLYSYGAASDNERALGCMGFSSIEGVQFGVQLVNNTGATVTAIDISYVGEQWRLNQDGNQTLTFDYQVGATDLTSGTWTPVTQLNFTAPQQTGTTGAIDGNLPANQTLKSYTLPVSINDGQSIWLRWNKWNQYSPGLAIDNFSVTAVTVTNVKGVQESEKTINIYPNPNNGNFQIIIQSQNLKNATIKIYNVIGEQIFAQRIEQNAIDYKDNIKLYDLPEGIYFVNVLTDDNSLNIHRPILIHYNK